MLHVNRLWKYSVILVSLWIVTGFLMTNMASAQAPTLYCGHYRSLIVNVSDYPVEMKVQIADDFSGRLVFGETENFIIPPHSAHRFYLSAIVSRERFRTIHRLFGHARPAFITLVNDVDWLTPVEDCLKVPSVPLIQIGDGRINDGANELGAPLAAYCSSEGITVWDIDEQGQGTLAFTATVGQINEALANALASLQNSLIAEGIGNSLYALSSNELAFVGPDLREPGKQYQFIAPVDVCG